ncbi:transposase [Adonisia turfae]|uniref:Transposase n=1 Tax=Adonisia turfae CCMR0081 TaxID=2292702 RepID=A0A6M0RWV8_9CYAN|nr:transposase [Adonisia turfae]NEZ60705.1 transposase [Adonisia turfae CCMR0081]
MLTMAYRNRFKGTSMRLPQRDYRRAGGYFLTLCTKKRECFFGDVVDGVMEFSAIGHMAKRCWQEIPDHCENVRIDEYVVMPNHLHGILIIERRLDNPLVETFHGRSLQEGSSLSQKMSAISPKRGSLGAIVRSYKSSVTRWCRQNGYSRFAWQSRFYEHIIRADRSIDYIRRYIVKNPSNWGRDRNHPRKLLPPIKSPSIT